MSEIKLIKTKKGIKTFDKAQNVFSPLANIQTEIILWLLRKTYED